MKNKSFKRAKHNPMALSLRNFKSAKVKSVKHYSRKVKHKNSG